jgi:hypothetical protein
MLRRTVIFNIIVTLGFCCVARAELPVRFVLARQVIIADHSPSPYLPQESELIQAFKAKFEAAFPNQVLSLDNPDQMISPNERIIVIVPTITIARMTDDLIAGTIHNYNALVVGDVSAIDPWTDANLYSGTRMVERSFKIGESEISHVNATATDAFKAAIDRWQDATIEQMQKNLAPFVLDSTTLSIPEKEKHFKGGIWTFGSQRGVYIGQILNGGPGHYAKVFATFPHYSEIQDVSNPSRTIPAGERYTLTLVDKPTERPEPSVELSWLGNPPSSPDGGSVQVLSPYAMVNLFDNYLSQGGGIKILPPMIDNPLVKEQLTKLSQEVSSRSKLIAGNVGTFERENLIIKAASNPDRIIEVGILECYHGRKTKENGTIENYYRLTLAASIRERTGVDEEPLYSQVSVIKHVEELANTEAQGIRDIDPSGIYLTLFRNAVINLAKKVREGSTWTHRAGEKSDAVVSQNGIAWNGTQPGAFTPLTWLRPSGEVKSDDGKLIGTLYKFMTPSQGYLNASVASREKLEMGDVLSYQIGGNRDRPIVAMRLEIQNDPPVWLPESPWLLRLAANNVGPAGDVQVVPLDGEEVTPFGVNKVASVKISALSSSSQGQTTTFTGQWRCQVRSLDSDPSVPPLIKFGIQSDSPVVLKNAGPSLQPLDISGWGLDYTLNALKVLTEAGTGKGVRQTFYAVN